MRSLTFGDPPERADLLSGCVGQKEKAPRRHRTRPARNPGHLRRARRAVLP